MRRILFMCIDAALAFPFLIPAMWIMNKRYFRNWKKALGYFVFGAYLCAMYTVVGLPTAFYVRLEPNLQLVPFAYMFSDYMNSLLNVALFMPLGFFLPVFWNGFQKLPQVGLFGFCTSLVIELLQIFTFRATDVNDLITNTLGALLGWCAAKVLFRLFPGAEQGWNTKDAVPVIGISFGVMFLFQPLLAQCLY